jgi:tRNA modification GTPase
MPDSTFIVELTPVGRGAVAVVLVAGPDAVRAVEGCFRAVNGKRFGEARADRIVLGRWGGEGGEELIGCRRADGTVEIHCHGGVAAVRNVVDRLAAEGGTPISWQEWTQRSDGDPIRAAARIALAEAPTARTAGILLDQLHGALSDAVNGAVATAGDGEWNRAVEQLDALLAHRCVGLHLTRPWRVVIAGRPNVGKSSLMNALAGFQRAIVCDVPGTTRDVVTFTTAIDGWPVELADTAGLRETADAIESAGVERATAAAADADLLVLVEDATQAQPLPAALPPSKLTLRVLNKIDLQREPTPPAERGNWDVLTSAVTGRGIAELLAVIGRKLVPVPPCVGAGVPFTAEQVEALGAARMAALVQDRAAFDACTRRLLIP